MRYPSIKSVTPRSRRYVGVTVTYIRMSKIPHIYTLNISTGKNQSTEVRVTLYIPTYEYNYKVVTRCDKYYKNITHR